MKDVAPEDVPDYILGYTCANDVTARDLQLSDVSGCAVNLLILFAHGALAGN